MSLIKNHLMEFFLLCAFFSVLLLSTTAPNLIAFIPYLFIILAIISGHKKLAPFLPSWLLPTYISILLLSIFLSIFFHEDLSSLKNAAKLIFLTFGFLLLCSTKSTPNLFKQNRLSLALPVIFFFFLSISLLQIYLETPLKNLISSYDNPKNIKNTNDLAICCVTFSWFVLAVINKFKSFGKYSIALSLIYFFFVFFAAALSSSAAATLAVFFGTSFLLIAFLFKKKSAFMAKLFIFLSILFVFFIPKQIYQLGPDHKYTSFIKEHLEKSALIRIDIWDKTVEKIIERPIVGWGNSDSKYLNLSEEPFLFNKTRSRPEFLYSHNIFLQIFVEMGFLGFLILLFFINRLIDSIQNFDPSLRPFALASLITIIFIWMVGYPLWRSWWLVFIGINAYGFFLLSKHQKENPV